MTQAQVSNKNIERINAQLPQTQCGLCDYPGCRPYAEAIINQQAPINRCLPGGVETLIAIANIQGINPAPMEADMHAAEIPDKQAVIDEESCIGCTKCIQACPTDAIIGARKLMHTIISDACTGCELCLPPCPVDCITIHTLPKRISEEKKYLSEQWRTRYEKKQKRLKRDQAMADASYETLKMTQTLQLTLAARRSTIKASIHRVKQKKNHPPA